MRHRRGRLMVGIGAVALAVAATGIDGAGAQENTVVVAPDQGPPGTEVEVRSGPGSGCGTPDAPGDEARVRLVDGAGAVVAETTVGLDPSAAWTATATVPSDAVPGVLEVLAACLVGGEVGFDYTPSVFTVTAPPTTTTTAAPSTEGATPTDEGEPTAVLQGPSGTGWESLLPGLVAIAVILPVLGLLEWGARGQARRRGDQPDAVESGTNGRLGLYAFVAVVVFTVGWIVAGWLQTGYSPRRELIDGLGAVTADHAWMIVGGFVLLGVTTAFLALGLRRWCVRVGTAPLLLALAGLAFVLAGVFRLDCSTTTTACEGLDDAGLLSWHHGAHVVVSALALTLLWFATLLLGLAARKIAVWRAFAVYSLVTVVALAPLYGLLVADVPASSIGIVQRVAMTVALAWVGVVGLQLYRTSRRAA